jgi:WD40 repeat protein
MVRLKYENNFYLVTPELPNIVFWDYNKGTKYKTLSHAHKNYIFQIISFEDVMKYMLVTCSYDKSIKIWDTKPEICNKIDTNNPVWLITRIKNYNRNYFISCENNNYIRIWNVLTPECIMSTNIIKAQSISYLIQPGFMTCEELFFLSGSLKLIQIKDNKLIGSELIEDMRISAYCFIYFKGRVLFICSIYNKELKFYELMY